MIKCLYLLLGGDFADKDCSSYKVKKEGYHRALKDGKLSYSSIKNLIVFMESKGMILEELTKDTLRRLKITGYLGKLKLYKCRGNRSWKGLVVGFPGAIQDLTPEYIGTPYLRKILYPILDLYINLNKGENLPCLYILGRRFNEVFLRKFRFLNTLIPHVIILSEDLIKSAKRKKHEVQNSQSSPRKEQYYQSMLCEVMRTREGLKIYTTKNKHLNIGYLSHEFSTVQGTKRRERLDILGYELDDHSLIAFEIKGPEANKVEMENLFFQGMEHRDWLEENKMAIKFAFDGPRGQRIHARKRVKLVLGFFDDSVIEGFDKLRAQAIRKDRYLEIYYVKLNEFAPIQIH